MAKILKVQVCGPYVNTDQTHYQLVEDDFDPEGSEGTRAVEDAVWDYVDAYCEVVDESDVPEEDLAWLKDN